MLKKQIVLNDSEMKQIFFIFLYSMFGIGLFAQEDYTTVRNASDKTKKEYKEAYSFLMANEIKKAEKILLKLIKRDPTFINSYRLIGDLYGQEQEIEKSVHYFEKSIQIAPNHNPTIYFSLAKIYMSMEKYNAAKRRADSFLQFKNINERLRNIAKKIVMDASFRPYAKANPVPFEPSNLGSGINSDKLEYFPSVTALNDLVYTVQYMDRGRKQEDLYFSLNDGSTWSKGMPIANVNTPENEGAQSISADGKLLVYTVCNRPNDYGSCDLYYSKKINGVWSKPMNMGPPINTSDWESQPSIGPNGSSLFFARGGARGEGTTDLYISHLGKDGKWETPKPISELNTPFNESSPSIHPDGKTLYFASDGYPGMGSKDIYVSKRNKEGKWSKPLNLGFPINTIAEEATLAVDFKGNLAYLSSDRPGGYGGLDIYSFELPDYAKPDKVTYIKGKTIDKSSQKPISAAVEIIDLTTQELFAKMITRADGEFLVCLPLGIYSFHAERPGYAFYSANYTLEEESTLDKPYDLIAPLQPIVNSDPKKKNEPIILKNVFFETASASLLDKSKSELQSLTDLLQKNPKIKIRISGHTDNIGSDDDNLILSQKRAAEVVAYLIKKGIDPSRLSSEGLGETRPIASNDTEEGRANNRRTTFQIINSN